MLLGGVADRRRASRSSPDRGPRAGCRRPGAAPTNTISPARLPTRRRDGAAAPSRARSSASDSMRSAARARAPPGCSLPTLRAQGDDRPVPDLELRWFAEGHGGVDDIRTRRRPASPATTTTAMTRPPEHPGAPRSGQDHAARLARRDRARNGRPCQSAIRKPRSAASSSRGRSKWTMWPAPAISTKRCSRKQARRRARSSASR